MPDVLHAVDLASRCDEQQRTLGSPPQHSQSLPEVEPSATPPALRPHPVWMLQLLHTFSRQRRVRGSAAFEHECSLTVVSCCPLIAVAGGIAGSALSTYQSYQSSDGFTVASAGRFFGLGEHSMAFEIHWISFSAAYT